MNTQLLDRKDLNHDTHPATAPTVITNENFDEVFAGQVFDATKEHSYAPETAGALMHTAFTAVLRDVTVADALIEVRAQARNSDNIYTIYVINPDFRLEGVVSLRELMIAEPHATVGEVMTHPAMCVTTDTDQERVVRVFQELDSISVPVVDRDNRLVGIVTVDDALDIQEAEHTEDVYKSVGMDASKAKGLDAAKAKEAKRSNVLLHGNMWQILKLRLPILLLVLVGGFLAGFIVEGFEEVLDEIVVVAFFIPLIMDMGGSIGGQSTTIFARGFVLNQMKPGTFGKALAKEALVGLTIGSIVGFFGFFAVWAWLGNPMIGLAVSLALVANCVMAAFFGFIVPWFLTKVGFDQAAGSGPIITSIKDITGLLVYFGFVMLFLSHML